MLDVVEDVRDRRRRPGARDERNREPRQKLFLSDGKTAVFYVPGERQARKTAVKKLDDFRSPLRYLLGKTKLEKEFEAGNRVEGVMTRHPRHNLLGSSGRLVSMGRATATDRP